MTARAAQETLVFSDRTVRVKYSARRSVSVEVTPVAGLLVRAPERFPRERILAFLTERSDWIEAHIREAEARLSSALPPLTDEEIRRASRMTRLLLADRLPALAEKIGVRYTKVAVRVQRTRYGSCSSLGHLNFHACLSLLPAYAAEYVMIHELCHLRYMNHSAAFWKLVDAHCPRAAEAKTYLKNEGRILIDRFFNTM